MDELIFYEKPGCVGNAMQRKALLDQGVRFQVRDLLSEPWDARRLRPFFGDKPVSRWFNETAPEVKSGEVAIGRLSEEEALELMVVRPILIRRPLLEYGGLTQSGFEAGPVLTALGVTLEEGEALQSCPMRDSEEDSSCETPV